MGTNPETWKNGFKPRSALGREDVTRLSNCTFAATNQPGNATHAQHHAE
jgi:hypothetical protein